MHFNGQATGKRYNFKEIICNSIEKSAPVTKINLNPELTRPMLKGPATGK